MTINTAPFVQAFTTFRRSLAQAVDFTNPNYTNSAITRERFKQVMDARAALLDKIPAAKDADADAQIAEVLDGLAPKNADEVALQEVEWRKVSALVTAGRSLEALILAANPLRLAAIAQWIEVSPEALASVDPSGVIAEVRELVFQQLVEHGVRAAVRVRDLTADANIVAAWRNVLIEALEGAVSLGTMSRMAHLDPQGYAALGVDENLDRDIQIDYKVEKLDGLNLRRDTIAAK
ncbi:hypothetical protein [Microbacterium paraoxydans]|uniref:Uncharacterized protein n=1 Tax=Microbacterium paraoxydans TaxID=199592 RepID=A0A1H1PXC6_9MICO|nr:hypothetical protein [Microbacterium paraoxydans]SDS15862.1 hypothetical protein SAMN04489809_1218 [Microbacterium paraoxydans]